MPEQDAETVTHGTTNVFAGVGRPDAGTHLLKAPLGARLRDRVDPRGLTQAAAARPREIAQRDLGSILSGRFREGPT
jgi:hypothetical protein